MRKGRVDCYEAGEDAGYRTSVSEATKVDYVTVTSCSYLPVLIGGTLSYGSSIHTAYGNATSGDEIFLQALDFLEPLSFAGGKNISLKGGYNCDFSDTAGFTTINGMLTISNVAITVEKIIIQ